MTTLIAIDAGNSSIKYGLFKDGELAETWRHELDATAELAASYLKRAEAPVALASVAPSAEVALGKACEQLKRPLFRVTAASQSFISGMDATMGADRVADVVAAWQYYGKGERPVLQMGFGTATTLLSVDAQGMVTGGWIAPGVRPSLEVLHERCQLLPLLKMENYSPTLGVDTETCMRNGVLLGHIGMVREWLSVGERALARSGEQAPARKAVSEPARPVTVATGGWSSAIQELEPLFEHVDRNLTLRGIYLIAEAAGFLKTQPGTAAQASK